MLFLSTLSLRRATIVSQTIFIWVDISIHALLAESDVSFFNTQISKVKISIHALLAESDMFTGILTHDSRISIHALLAESDSQSADSEHKMISISIHALLAESDAKRLKTPCVKLISIHALLAESDDIVAVYNRLCFCDFYPRSPCGERLNSSYGALDGASISIHALLAESDSVLHRSAPLQQ